jgi:Na+/melibiose symporter-like transporter
VIFFVNVPVGLLAQYLIHRHMPNYRGDAARPLDVVGLVLFGSGTALLSWLLEIFGEHQIDPTSAAVLFVIAMSLLAAYALHARRTEFPLLRLTLFQIRTFRVSVVGGFVTRLGLGGMPFLLPLLYQVGIGLPAWQSGMLMMPAAAAAMCMKLIAPRLLRRFGYRRILISNTLMIGTTICTFSFVSAQTPIVLIVLLGLSQGFFNSLQFSSMNTMAYADVKDVDSSMASTIASSMQQMSLSFGLAIGSLAAGWFLGGLPQTDRAAVTSALHHAFLTLGVVTFLSSVTFWSLRPEDGESVSKGAARKPVDATPVPE